MSSSKTVSLVDYLVLAGAMTCSLLAGLFYSYKERNYNSSYRFHRGGGKLKPLPVALSLIVTFESSIFFLGKPAEVYIHGIQFWLNTLGFAIAFSGVLWISIPLFFPLQITSVYEYLERRYGSRMIRQLATCLSTLSMIVYSGIVLFGASVAIEPVTNIPKESSIIGMTVVAMIYTSLGGIKAVVVTDVVQTVFMIIGMIAVLVYGILAVGGIDKVIALNDASGRMNYANFDINPLTRHTVWSLVFGGVFIFLPYPFHQPIVQRLNSTKSMSDARRVVIVALVGFVILDVFVLSEGLVAYAYFSNKGCDPLAAGKISNPNQIMPYAVLSMFEDVPGISGLYLAALCSAVLSTVSSHLGSISAILSEDIIKAYWKTLSDQRLTMISKIIVPMAGIFIIGFALVFGGVKGPVTQIASIALGAVEAPIASIFIMSVFVKFSTKKGVLSGALIGLVFGIWVSLGSTFSPGRKQTPWLPLGPTDKCNIVANISVSSTNSVLTSMGTLAHRDNYLMTTLDFAGTSDLTAPTNGFDLQINGTSIAHMAKNAPTTPGYSMIYVASSQDTIHGLDNLYSVSYLYLCGMATIVSLLIAALVSKCTQPDKPARVSPQLMLSCSPQCFCWSVDNGLQEKDDDDCVHGDREEMELRQALAEGNGCPIT